MSILAHSQGKPQLRTDATGHRPLFLNMYDHMFYVRKRILLHSNYPAVKVAAINFDRTGTTKIGNNVDHFVP